MVNNNVRSIDNLAVEILNIRYNTVMTAMAEKDLEDPINEIKRRLSNNKRYQSLVGKFRRKLKEYTEIDSEIYGLIGEIR